MQELLSQGWQVSEFTNWISFVERDQFIEMLGQENILFLEQEEKKQKWKAKMIISPKGISILNLFFVTPAGHA